jgi:hypothetical protein
MVSAKVVALSSALSLLAWRRQNRFISVRMDLIRVRFFPLHEFAMPPSSVSSPQPNCWLALATLLDSADDECGLRRVFPADHQRLSVLDALESLEVAESQPQREQGAEVARKLRGLISQLNVFDRVSHCPVVAITGLLNAGKSSLLATYLSPEGRRRVLRGVGNQQGTHRFVIWLPQVWWSDSELLSTLIGLLTNIFGHPPEQLSSDIGEAQQQYNGMVLHHSLMRNGKTPGDDTVPGVADAALSASTSVDPMSIPLIASDRGLDSLKLGLVDCPDIQTGILADRAENAMHGAALATSRREQLARIGRLCSAFVIVSKLSSLHDESLVHVLTTLRDSMPGVPRILAINKVKARYAPEIIAEESRLLTDRFSIRSLFAAYDYRSSLAGPLIPPPPPGMLVSDAEPQPIFFEIGTQTPDTCEYLYDLSRRLDAGALARESHRSLSLQLQSLGAQASEWIKCNALLRNKQVTAAWQAIAKACFEFMAERDEMGLASGLRLQASPAILAQMADSLQRTAPPWMRFSMMLDRTARQFQQAVSSSAARFKMWQSASNAVSQFAKSFKRGEGAQVVTAQQLAEAIRKADTQDSTARLSDDELVLGCEIAMKRFSEEDKTLLDSERLDELTKEIWSRMPLSRQLWKATQPLALLTAPFLAAVLIPFDGGGTTVLVFASMKELLIATGLAAVLGPTVMGGAALQILHREAPWRQLSDLFAHVCDSLGVPRPSNQQLPSIPWEGLLRQLQCSSLPEKQPASNAAMLSQWELVDGFQQRLRAALNACQ